MSFEIYPLFSSVVCGFIAEENFDEEYKKLKNELFDKTSSEIPNNQYISKNKQVLDNFSSLNKIIFDHFNDFKNNTLKYETTDFKISSSWMTKTPPNAFGEYHKHKNCFYSGVLYFQDDISCIQFQSYNVDNQSIKINDPTERNIYNSTSFKFKPQKNLILFFPSYLYHRMEYNSSGRTRYSLAFNFTPVGEIGKGSDSYMINN